MPWAGADTSQDQRPGSPLFPYVRHQRRFHWHLPVQRDRDAAAMEEMGRPLRRQRRDAPGNPLGLLVYLRDPTQACKKTSGQDPVNMRDGFYFAQAERSAPTPFVAPTPTPTPSASAALEAAAARMASIEALDFTLTRGNRAKRVEGPLGPPPDRVDLQPIGPRAGAMSRPFQFDGLGPSRPDRSHGRGD